MRNFIEAASHQEWHAEVGPALYGDFARQHVIPAIDRLAVPNGDYFAQVGLSGLILHAANLIHAETRKDRMNVGPNDEPMSYGYFTFEEAEEIRNKHIYQAGFGDLEFPLRWSGHMSRVILAALDKPSDQMTVFDFGALLQCGWFGKIANEAAITGVTNWQNIISNSPLNALRAFHGVEPKDFLDENIWIDGRKYFEISKDGIKALRAQLRTSTAQGVGCPVARTSFTASEGALELLRQRVPQFDDTWVERPRPNGASQSVFTQGDYTVIDDTICAWGKYFERTCEAYPEIDICQPSALRHELILA